MNFRPCIDLHNGKVKQIVGSSLVDGKAPETNFCAAQPPAWFSNLYRRHNLKGGHVIKLGPNNDQAAKEALAAWPGGLQIGGGVHAENAASWIEAGASHVIVTSTLFEQGQVSQERLDKLVAEVGKEHLVIDLSCRKKMGKYYVVTDRWQTFTRTSVDAQSLSQLSDYCDEFLIHGVDVEGKKQGIDLELVDLLAQHCPITCVYAGGVRCFEDLKTLHQVSAGRIDVTIGSALELFGGTMAWEKTLDFFRKA